ncbi:K+/H+ antiporter subunit F [Agrobacterium sp. V1]|jgi:multicomponent K+:H+ antiporter subunit F|uniref:K+/H+ antiporter subunit F n=1 Tax=Agrobacterium sp. V1 TaxID=3061957 RepID=UPI00267244C9|nr:K+/H+ antiporter subunit F [Agrobacterium sp. V1]MDO3445180.1 K+/H+ antiporter subunit F [Agrobacterium sp. V1]
MMLSADIIYWSATLAQGMLLLAMAFAAYRLIKGPRAQDRVMAIDTIYNIGILQALVLAIKTGNALYLPFILILAILGFVSTVALAKFLMRGEVIE